MTPAEIGGAIEVFLQLEPEIQKGIVALIHLIHKPNPMIPVPVVTQAISATSSGE